MTSPSPITVYPGTTARFAPGPWCYVSRGDVAQATKDWNTWFEPYYRGWINRNRGELPGVFIKNQTFKAFYVNEAKRPADETNPNDSNYNWDPIDDFLSGMPCLSEGRAAFHIMIRPEGRGYFPDWMESAGYIYQPTNQNDLPKPIPDFANAACVQAFKNFYEALATRYNNNTQIWSIGIGECSGRGPSTDAAFASIILHACDTAPNLMFSIGSNGTLYGRADIMAERQIICFHPDPKPGSHGCSVNWPNCANGGRYFGRNAIGTSTNNPRPIAWGSEPNGLRWTGGSMNVANPFGVASLPDASHQMPNTNLDYFVLLWYFSASPRAPSPRDDSGLGQNGRDPNGILPVCNFAVALSNGTGRMEGVTPQHVNAAMRAFGAAGTQALFHPPVGFDASGAGDPDPVILAAGDGTIADGETGFLLSVSNAGGAKGTGWVRLYADIDLGGTYATQTATAWADDEITITGVGGSLTPGTVYLAIENDAGDRSSVYPIILQSSSAGPVILAASTTIAVPGNSITLTGTDFEAAQGSGGIELNTAADGSGTAVAQTETAWGAASAAFTVNTTGFDPGQTVYAILTTDSALESDGYALTVQPVDVPVILTAEDAVFYDGETGVDITGANFGAEQGDGGQIWISDQPDGSGINVAQAVESWGDALLRITVILGALDPATDHYLAVRADSGQISAAFPINVLTTVPAPEITSVQPSTVAEGVQIVVNGRHFGDAKGLGWCALNMAPDHSGLGGVCTIQGWTDSQILATVIKRSMTPGTRYVFVQNAQGVRNADGYPVTLTDDSALPVLSSVGAGAFYDGQTSVTVTGSNFEAAQGAGKLVLNASPAVEGGTVQAITSWGDTSITFDVDQGAIPFGAAWAIVVNDSGGVSQPVPIVFIANPAPGVVDTESAGYSDTGGFSDWDPGATTTLIDSDITEDTDTDSINLTVNVGAAAGSDRMLYVATVARSTDALSAYEQACTLDGVALTEIVAEYFKPDDTRQKIILWRMGDADLPATTGNYTLQFTTQGDTSNYLALAFALYPGIAQQADEAQFAKELDNVTTISNSITTQTDGALLIDAGYYRGAGTLSESAGSRALEITGTAISLALGAEFIASAGAQTRGWDIDQSAETMLLAAAAFAVSGAGGANDAYGGVARETAGDDSGDEATFTFSGVPASSEIVIQEWHPSTAAASDVPVGWSGIASGSTTIDQSSNGGQWHTVATLSAGYSAGTLTVTLGDNANDTVIANALRLVVTPVVDGVSMDLSETLTLVESMSNAGIGTRTGGAKSTAVIIDATTITEKIEGLDTAAIADPVGDFRIPLTKTFGAITSVYVEFISLVGGWDWTVIDRDPELGPRLKLWRFAGGSWIPSNAVVNITVVGVGAE